MGININIPQIQALRCEVEKVFGKISSHSCLHKLSEDIEQKCKEHISVSTLERLWNYSTRNATNISVRILDIVSSYAGADCWEDFCNRLQKESNAKGGDTHKDWVVTKQSMRSGIHWKLPLCGNAHRKFEYKAGRQLPMPANRARKRTVPGLFHPSRRGYEQQHCTLRCRSNEWNYHY